jgi:polysaccharide biosynthesis transport protein
MTMPDTFSALGSRSQNLDLALEAWLRRRWLALFVFAAVAAATISFAVSLPNLYRATASVLIERQQVSEALVRPAVTAELETRLQTIREDVTSRARLTDLIVRLDLYPELRGIVPLEGLVAKMRRDVELELRGVDSPLTGRNATVAFMIRYVGRDPESVARVANELAGLYVQENTRIRERQSSKTAEFLRAQLAEAKRELDEYERRVNQFRLSHIGELPQQVQLNLSSLERLNTQLRLNGENQLRALDRRERLERQQAETAAAPPAVTVSPDQDRLAKLRQQLDDLQGRFTDAYPDVVRVRTEIDALTRQLSQRAANSSVGGSGERKRLEQSIAAVDSELQSLADEEQILRQAIASYEQRVENIPKRQQEFDELSRDYDTTRERYQTLLKRYEEAQLADSLEQGRAVEQFRILDAALPPREPVAPNRLQLLVLGFGLAIGLAFLAVLAAEKLDTTFHSIDDLRGFISVGMLGRVPLIPSIAERRRNRRRALLTVASAAAALVLVAAGSHFVAEGNEQMVRMMDRGRG